MSDNGCSHVDASSGEVDGVFVIVCNGCGMVLHRG